MTYIHITFTNFESQFSKPKWSDSKALNPIPLAVAFLLGEVIISGDKKAVSRFWVNSVDGGALHDFLLKYCLPQVIPKSLSLDCHLAFIKFSFGH